MMFFQLLIPYTHEYIHRPLETDRIHPSPSGSAWIGNSMLTLSDLGFFFFCHNTILLFWHISFSYRMNIQSLFCRTRNCSHSCRVSAYVSLYAISTHNPDSSCIHTSYPFHSTIPWISDATNVNAILDVLGPFCRLSIRFGVRIHLTSPGFIDGITSFLSDPYWILGLSIPFRTPTTTSATVCFL